MITASFTQHVTLPTVADFALSYPQYGPWAYGSGAVTFAQIMLPETFLAAKVLTDLLGLPAVTAVAASAHATSSGALRRFDKQFAGAAMCCLMEANGYAKTGQKRSVPWKGWTKGEVYR